MKCVDCNKPTAKSRGCRCERCKKRHWRKNNPIKAAYANLRDKAIHTRGIAFNLTLEEFKDFCTETNYIQLKGKHKGSMTIDRIDHTKGYEKGNIQAILLEENSAKGHLEGLENCPF